MRRFAQGLLCLTLFAVALHGAPVVNGFSYQGRLLEAGAPAQGRYDFRFALFATDTATIASSSIITNTAVSVSNGVFHVLLDFGTTPVPSSAGWLEIAVRPNGSAAEFTTLAPRQMLAPTPYSIYTLKAEALVGPLPDSQLSTNIARLNAAQTFSGPVTFEGAVSIGRSNSVSRLEVHGSLSAAQFSGNGAGLSNVTAQSLSAAAIQKLWRTPISFVTVTNAGNEADSTGLGAVPYSFRIGRFEVTHRQYAAFLNAVASDDVYSLYSTNMTFDVNGGIIRTGSPGDYAYSVKPGMEHRPVVWVDFRDVLRFCNWLHNGQPAGEQDHTTTEDGAYTITPEARIDTLAWANISRNPGARYFLPSDDEWYKAAYHQPWDQGGPVSDYWLYPTRSDDTPFVEPPPGSENSINAREGVMGAATDVGAYVNARSFYGTLDQGGNVQEWTEGIVYGTSRRVRGGSWVYNVFYANTSDFEFDTVDYDAEAIGFRVAGTVGQ